MADAETSTRQTRAGIAQQDFIVMLSLKKDKSCDLVSDRRAHIGFRNAANG